MDPDRIFTTVLFDLDGTLVEVEMRTFIPAYIDSLAARFADFSDSLRFGEAMREAIFDLIEDPDLERTNEEQFLSFMETRLAIPGELFRTRLRGFAHNGLADLAPLVRPASLAREILERVRARGLRIVLATNPVFPLSVIDARLAWGGLADFPFDLITSYENSSFCKPQPDYFREILGRLDLTPASCLMVGNDTVHDLSAKRAGIATFLVDDFLVDRPGAHFSPDFRGSRIDLLEFFSALPAIGEN